MSTIDEIMIAAMDYADERVMVAHGRGTQGGVHRAVCVLRDMITATIADRPATDGSTLASTTPTSAAPSRQAVRLTGEEIDAVAAEVDCIEVHTDGATEFARAIESAVLAANGLGDAK